MAAIPAYDLGQVVSVLQHGLDQDFQAVVLEVGDGQDVQRARALTAPAVILVWSDGASADDQGRLVERIGVLLTLRDATALAMDNASRGAKLRALLAASRVLLDGQRPPGAHPHWEKLRWTDGALHDLGEPTSLRHAWRDRYRATWQCPRGLSG